MSNKVIINDLKEIYSLRVACHNCGATFMIPQERVKAIKADPELFKECPSCRADFSLVKHGVLRFMERLGALAGVSEFSFFFETYQD